LVLDIFLVEVAFAGGLAGALAVFLAGAAFDRAVVFFTAVVFFAGALEDGFFTVLFFFDDVAAAFFTGFARIGEVFDAFFPAG
jgi:hypothetical protein